MGTTNKSLEDLKKELSNMHKQFDSLLADKKVSEQLDSTIAVENIPNEKLKKKKKNITGLTDEKKDVISLHGNISEESVKDDLVLESENLIKEIKQEKVVKVKKEKDFFIKEIENQKQKNQYLSIKEKLDKIKGEINTKELEISLKSLDIEDIKDDSPKELVQKTNIVNTKKKGINEEVKDIVKKQKKVTNNSVKSIDKKQKNNKKNTLNIVISILIVAIALLVYFIFLT